MLRIQALAFAIAMALFPAAAGMRAPTLSASSLSSLTVPERPYDEGANADAAVTAALAQAKITHRRVLIDLGGNWCADCLVLSGVMNLPEMQRFLSRHYVVVMVDVGRFNRNLQVPARFGITGRPEGVPMILIANPDGSLVNRDRIFALDEARGLTAQSIADWLAQWAN